jgi:hypothetical protein
MRNVAALYLRSIREAIRRSNDPELAVVWKFALSSVAFIVFALLSLGNAIAGDGVLASIVAAGACFVLSAATGAYVVFAVRRSDKPEGGG